MNRVYRLFLGAVFAICFLPVWVQAQSKTVSKEQLIPNLIYLCDFEQSLGDQDQSPAENHGLVKDLESGPGRGGFSQKGLQFTKPNQLLSIPVNVSPFQMPEMTLCLWVNCAKTNQQFQIASHDDQKFDRCFGLQRRNKEAPLEWALQKGVGGRGFLPGPIKFDQWVFAAIRYEHDLLRSTLVVDDEVVSFSNSACGPGKKVFSIGHDKNWLKFQGMIDDLCLFDRALSLEEIQAIRQGTLFADLSQTGAKIPAIPTATEAKPTRPTPSNQGGLIFQTGFEGTSSIRDHSPERNDPIVHNVKILPGRGRGETNAGLFVKDSQLEIPRNINPHLMPQFTFSAWVKPEGTDKANIFSMDNWSWDRKLVGEVTENSSEITWTLGGGISGQRKGPTSRRSEWTFVAVVYDHHQLRGTLFVNGSEQSFAHVSCGHGLPFFCIGKEARLKPFLEGYLDDIRVYSRALSMEELNSLMQQPPTSSVDPLPNPPVKSTESPEAWVSRCKVDSMFKNDHNWSDARRGVQGHSLKRMENWGWIPRGDRASGIMVVHPHGTKRPATIRVPTDPANPYPTLRMRVRGCDSPAGTQIVTLGIRTGDKEVYRAEVGRDWQDLDIPIYDHVEGDIEIQVIATNWHFEYCYFDWIEVQ